MIEQQVVLLVYFLLVISPPLVLATIFVKLDMFQEPLSKLLITFFLAFAATSIMVEIKYGLLVIPEEIESRHFINSLFFIALPEELTKFLVLFIYCSRLKEFNEPMDGLVYGSIAGLGFAVNEAFYYSSVYQDYYEETSEVIYSILERGLLAVPGHAFDGIIMGAFLGIALFRKVNKTFFIILGILISIAFHTLWDWILFEEVIPSDLVYIVFLVQFVTVFSLFRYFRKLQRDKILEFELRNE